jgi:hypothetical protein
MTKIQLDKIERGLWGKGGEGRGNAYKIVDRKHEWKKQIWEI